MNKRFSLTVNGRRQVVEAEPDTPLLYVLRDDLGLDGTRFGCGLGQCGACTVHVGGQAVRSCQLPLARVGDRPVRTIEGLASDRRLSALQHALLEAQAPQCAYCMSGITMTAAALLERNPHPTESETRAALEGNLCRCGCHLRVLRAVAKIAGGAA